MAKNSYATPMSSYENDVVYVKSDKFFNDPDCHKFFGDNCEPVDIFGGFVPQDKSMSNLKKAEKAIQCRFGLEAGGEPE